MASDRRERLLLAVLSASYEICPSNKEQRLLQVGLESRRCSWWQLALRIWSEYSKLLQSVSSFSFYNLVGYVYGGISASNVIGVLKFLQLDASFSF